MKINAFNVFIPSPNWCQKNMIHKLNMVMNMVTTKRFLNHSQCGSLSFPFNVEQTRNKEFPPRLLVKKIFIHRNHYQLLDFIPSNMRTHKCFKIRSLPHPGSGKRS
jgi:hypothetical protein